LWADRICTSCKLMEGLGQKKGDGQIVFCAMPLPVASAIPGKASNSKRPSYFHAMITATCRLMRISQNSSAFCGVRCVIARATRIENCRSRREAFRSTPVSAARKW
jgi:hypothetical protein